MIRMCGRTAVRFRGGWRGRPGRGGGRRQGRGGRRREEEREEEEKEKKRRKKKEEEKEEEKENIDMGKKEKEVMGKKK